MTAEQKLALIDLIIADAIEFSSCKKDTTFEETLRAICSVIDFEREDT